MTPAELQAALDAATRAIRSGYSREVSPASIQSVPAVTTAIHRLAALSPDALVDALAGTVPGAGADVRAAIELAYVCGRLAVARQVFERAVSDEFSTIYRSTRQ
jgi:hypothetical protein